MFINTKISNISTVTETNMKIMVRDYRMSDIPDEILDVDKYGYE